MRGYVLGSLAAVGLLFPLSAGAQENNYWVKLINNTDSSIVGLKIRHVGDEHIKAGDWSDNLIERPLRAGYNRPVYMSDFKNWCRFDVMVRFGDGSGARRSDFNACIEPALIANSAWDADEKNF